MFSRNLESYSGQIQEMLRESGESDVLVSAIGVGNDMHANDFVILVKPEATIGSLRTVLQCRGFLEFVGDENVGGQKQMMMGSDDQLFPLGPGLYIARQSKEIGGSCTFKRLMLDEQSPLQLNSPGSEIIDI